MSRKGVRRAWELKKQFKKDPDAFLNELVKRMLEPESKFRKAINGENLRTETRRERFNDPR
jgi:hypothetical protein